MDYLVLENTTLKVSRLCMGGCPMGGYGWGSVREDGLLAAIHAALDVGVNFLIPRIHMAWDSQSVLLPKGLARTARLLLLKRSLACGQETGKLSTIIRLNTSAKHWKAVFAD